MISHLLSKMPAPKASDWKCWNMSVAISLLANHRKATVNVTDTKVTFGDFAADNIAPKDFPLFKKCSVLVAGNDIEHVKPIMDRATAIVGKNPSVSDVAEAINVAIGERLHAEITRKVLHKHGFDVNSFRDEGKRKCPPSAYLGLFNRVDQVSLSLKFIVSGFDSGGSSHSVQGHIYAADGQGVPVCYDPVGMWAVGKGAHAALSYLAFLIQRHGSPSREEGTELALFFALGAKFMAESCGEVGSQTTFAYINEYGRPPHYISYEAIEIIKAMWSLEAAPRIPEHLPEKISGFLKEFPVPSSDKELMAKLPSNQKRLRAHIRQLLEAADRGGTKEKPRP
jgi:hypothetical protein